MLPCFHANILREKSTPNERCSVPRIPPERDRDILGKRENRSAGVRTLFPAKIILLNNSSQHKFVWDAKCTGRRGRSSSSWEPVVAWHRTCGKKMMNDDEDPIFETIADDNLLTVNHNDMPIYIQFLKYTLTMGHFVIVSSPRRNSFVGQIIR
jgi:hypothetical protein